MTVHFRPVSIPRILGVLLGTGLACWLMRPVYSQEPAATDPGAERTAARSVRPMTPDHVRPQAYNPQRRRSIVHHYPYPYPGYYQNDASAGFRNPGGVGRHAEYYPPGDQFQVQNDPVRVAQFGAGGGYPSRAEQMQAEQLGISRYNSIQQHIDNYAMPHWGFGFGVGGYGGFW